MSGGIVGDSHFWWSRLSGLAVVAALLVTAALKEGSPLSAPLVAAGLVVLGAWLAVEVTRITDAHYAKEHRRLTEDNNSRSEDS
jgi:uncharacterized membrane protein YhaH (DUF805 family)